VALPGAMHIRFADKRWRGARSVALGRRPFGEDKQIARGAGLPRPNSYSGEPARSSLSPRSSRRGDTGGGVGASPPAPAQGSIRGVAAGGVVVPVAAAAFPRLPACASRRIMSTATRSSSVIWRARFRRRVCFRLSFFIALVKSRFRALNASCSSRSFMMAPRAGSDRKARNIMFFVSVMTVASAAGGAEPEAMATSAPNTREPASVGDVRKRRWLECLRTTRRAQVWHLPLQRSAWGGEGKRG